MNKVKRWFNAHPGLTGILFIICSLLALIVYLNFENNITLSLFTTMFITGISSIFYGLFAEKNEETLDCFPILSDAEEYGLVRIKNRFPISKDNDLEIYNDFIYSDNVYIVLNDGKSFISNYASLIQERLIKNKSGVTFLIVLNYQNIKILDVLGGKNKKTDSRNYYRDKIINLLKESQVTEFLKYEKQFIVKLNNNFLSTAQILTDNYAMFSIYPNSSGKMEVPHYIFKNYLSSKGYMYVKKDIDNLISKSVDDLDIDSLNSEKLHK